LPVVRARRRQRQFQVGDVVNLRGCDNKPAVILPPPKHWRQFMASWEEEDDQAYCVVLMSPFRMVCVKEDHLELALNLGHFSQYHAELGRYFSHFEPNGWYFVTIPELEEEAISEDEGQGSEDEDEAEAEEALEDQAEEAPENKAEEAPEDQAEEAPETQAEEAPEDQAEEAPEDQAEEAPENQAEEAPENHESDDVEEDSLQDAVPVSGRGVPSGPTTWLGEWQDDLPWSSPEAIVSVTTVDRECKSCDSILDALFNHEL